jgi:hypothetical protein
MALTTDDLREMWDEIMSYSVSPQDVISMLLHSPDLDLKEFFLSGPDEDMLNAFAASIARFPDLSRRLGRMLNEDDGDLAIVLARYGLMCLSVGVTLGITAGREVFSNATQPD